MSWELEAWSLDFLFRYGNITEKLASSMWNVDGLVLCFPLQPRITVDRQLGFMALLFFSLLLLSLEVLLRIVVNLLFLEPSFQGTELVNITMQNLSHHE